jgi:hypothetical protein
MLSEAKHLIDSTHHSDASLMLQCGNASIINSDEILRCAPDDRLREDSSHLP